MRGITIGLEKVIEEIIASAQREAETVMAEGRTEASKIRSEMNEQIAELQTLKQKELAEAIERMRVQGLTAADLAVKKLILNAKKELLEQAYQQSLKYLGQLPDSKNQEYLQKLLKKATAEIPKGYIRCNARDSKFVQEHAAGLKFDTALNCVGGVIVENEDRTVKLDLRYETMLDELWDAVLKDVAKLAFG